MAEKTVATTSNQAANQPPQTKERTRGPERFVPPPVDIYETPEGLVLLADLPGVSPNDLKIRLEENILSIQAKPHHLIEHEPIYREFELVNFFRQFELSEEVDQEKIAASLSHGVLRLYLPRAEKAKPREIPVQIQTEKAAA
jgi:HSP20 family molecular chaperone IbpA